MVKLRKIADDLKTVIVVPIHKKGKPLALIDSYRLWLNKKNSFDKNDILIIFIRNKGKDLLSSVVFAFESKSKSKMKSREIFLL
jgi:hypothetical protein